MAVTHLSLVNQKLAYAGRLLGLAEQPGRSALEVQALLASAVMQQALAYRFYLRELGEIYQLKLLASIFNATQLQEALVQANRSPAEAEELVQLEGNTSSWLAQLLALNRAQEASPAPQATPKAFVGDGLINLVNISAEQEPDAAPLACEQLVEYLTAFRQLVLRQRQTSAEY